MQSNIILSMLLFPTQHETAKTNEEMAAILVIKLTGRGKTCGK